MNIVDRNEQQFFLQDLSGPQPSPYKKDTQIATHTRPEKRQVVVDDDAASAAGRKGPARLFRSVSFTSEKSKS